MTSIEQVATLATFGSVWAVLAVSHNLADHVLGQNDRQALNKGAPTAVDVAGGVNPRRGWGACMGHVAQYHVVMGVVLTLVGVVLPLELSWPGLLGGLVVSAVTHAFLDRRWPVRWLLQHTGKRNFAELREGGLNGMYLADQALHQTALLVSALVITRL
ncbi:hypothetical protein ACIA49_38845 [Kribbella sp. NPDC051587]|uniref:hypothetical protein n=1 Tax=Kribbella sp. NPDC051587 TaxID=3364119 RepID=UPI0037B7478F